MRYRLIIHQALLIKLIKNSNNCKIFKIANFCNCAMISNSKLGKENLKIFNFKLYNNFISFCFFFFLITLISVRNFIQLIIFRLY